MSIKDVINKIDGQIEALAALREVLETMNPEVENLAHQIWCSTDASTIYVDLPWDTELRKCTAKLIAPQWRFKRTGSGAGTGCSRGMYGLRKGPPEVQLMLEMNAGIDGSTCHIEYKEVEVPATTTMVAKLVCDDPTELEAEAEVEETG